MRSRHQKEVATEDKHLTEHLCRDIWMQSRHQHEVRSSCDSSFYETKVATSVALKRRSRQDQTVATSTTQKGSRNIIQWSRQHFSEKKVVTKPGCRDISCKGKRSRQVQVVATSIRKTSGRDIMKQSRQQDKKQRSRQHLVVATSAAKTRWSRQDQEVATSKYKELSGDVSKLSLQQLHRTEGRDII